MTSSSKKRHQCAWPTAAIIAWHSADSVLTALRFSLVLFHDATVTISGLLLVSDFLSWKMVMIPPCELVSSNLRNTSLTWPWGSVCPFGCLKNSAFPTHGCPPCCLTPLPLVHSSFKSSPESKTVTRFGRRSCSQLPHLSGTRRDGARNGDESISQESLPKSPLSYPPWRSLP